MNILNHKKTILIIILLLIAFFLYWFVFLSKKEVSDSTNKSLSQNSNLDTGLNTTNNNVAGNKYNKEFVSSLISLNSVDLDKSVIDSDIYKSLYYPEIPFILEYSKESGRNNPFLPIGVNINSLNIGAPSVSSQNRVNNSTSTNSNLLENNNISTTTVLTPVSISTSTSTPTSTSTSTPKPRPRNF